MKKLAYLVSVGVIVGTISCAKTLVQATSVEGTWSFQDAGESGLVQRTLVLENGLFQETDSENGVTKSSEGGNYVLKQEGDFVEIVITGTNSRVYTGRVAQSGLMIQKVNGDELSTPLFFKKG